MSEHLLSLVIFTPAIFALIALAFKESVAKWVCTLGAALTLAATVPLCLGFTDAKPLATKFTDLRDAVIEDNLDKEFRQVERRLRIELRQREGGRALLADPNSGIPTQLSQARKQAEAWLAQASEAEDEQPALRALFEKGIPITVLKTKGVEGGESLREEVARIELLGLYQKTRNQIRELDLACNGTMGSVIKNVEYADWIPAFNIHYFVGVDGLSLPLIFLTALLTFLCLVYSWNFDGDKEPEKRRPLKAFFILFMLLEAGLMGVFVSLDLFLFYVFWEVVLLPSYFLIGIWGGENRNYAAIKFFIYTLVGSVLMLVAMLALYFCIEPNTFNMLALIEQADQPVFRGPFGYWIFAAMFVAFAIKVPVFPFHTWLPDAHVQAPTAFSVMLAGVMLKMGGYGFFRLAYPLCPEAATSDMFIYGVALLGVINLIYGAFVALGQSDFKSLVAYSSVSHMGYVMLGLAAFTPAAIMGASLQMFNHGVSSAMMFFIVGVIYDRAHHRDLNKFGGLALQMPWYFGFAIIGFFASLGLPGLNGFISEFLVFFGVYQSTVVPKWMLMAALPCLVLTAAYILWTIKRVFLGELTNEKYKKFPDLNFNEVVALAPLGLMCIVVGVYPRIVTDVMRPAMDAILELATRTTAG